MYSCSGAGLRRTCICVLCVQSFSCLAAREPESRSGTEQLASASASATVALDFWPQSKCYPCRLYVVCAVFSEIAKAKRSQKGGSSEYCMLYMI